MQFSAIEAQYPKDFRREEQEQLIKHLSHRYSVQLIGMKRVGISNFLRFFLAQQAKNNKAANELFVAIDLKDMVEREVYPFWILTFKRLADAVQESATTREIKQQMQSLFLQSIQSQDLFLLFDNLRVALQVLVTNEIMPTLFFLRFDRMSDAFTAVFFDNIRRLRDVTNEKLTYVFTSYRHLEDLFPTAKTSIASLGQAMYIKPAKKEDMKIVYKTYEKMHYNFHLTQQAENFLFDLVAGNMQYLQLALVILNEKQTGTPRSSEELLSLLVSDERIMLQSEELWESVTREQQAILLKIAKRQQITDKEKRKASYLWNTGFVTEEEKEVKIFSPLLLEYVIQQKNEQEEEAAVELTRKEHLLFHLLQDNLGEICDREQIIETVWPEYQELGVSDWAIDRLVARVRVKLKKQKSHYQIMTVRTRGYKLTTVRE